MFFAIIFLCGMINSSFAMEKINENFSQQSDIDANNPFIVLSPACIPMASAPPEFCDSCFNWKSVHNGIMKTLKKTEVISALVEFKENQDFNDAMTLFNEAIIEKSIARERGQICKLNKRLQDPKINLDKNIRDKIAKRVANELAKNNPSVVQCAFDCMQDIQTVYNKPKSKPWTVSENVNNAFELMHNDLTEIVSVGICAIFFPVLLMPFFAVNPANLLVPYCVYKGLLAHADVKHCKCHIKPNETFKCAYRLMYVITGFLFFLYTYRSLLPSFARR